MGFAVTVRGAAGVREVAHQLKVIGDAGLGKAMAKQLRAASEVLRPAIRAQARTTLPSGYAPTLAAALQFRQSVRAAKQNAQVVFRTTAQGRRQPRHVDRLNAGHLRHTRWGDRRFWYSQRVPPGLVDKPVDRLKPEIARRMDAVVDDVAQQLGAA